MSASPSTADPTADSGLVLVVLAAGQFLMTLDSSVMNVSMATVAADLGTTVTGIQTAITLYTLVMATMMITGGKVGTIIGRRRAFGIGLIVYGAGSFVTSIAPNLDVLLLGWSLLEGLGAALIMPAIVALVASNFPPARRTSAYGLIAASGAMAVAAGPLIGGAVTTYFSWRYVFAGEVVIVIAILAVLRKVRDVPPEKAHIDYVGSVLSVVGLGLVVFGVLRSSTWGWVVPKPDGPSWGGVSPVLWLIVGGILVVYGFLRWETHLEETNGEPLLRPSMLGNRQLSGGLGLFFSQFATQAGVFFAIPLFLSVVLGMSAVETGVRILPLSIALLLAAAGIPKLWPRADPRRVVRLGLAAIIVGILVLIAAMDPGASAEIVTVPLILLGLGLGALSSQLGAVAVSAVPDNQSAEVGGLQNTATNLGASLGTALVGSVLIATLTSALVAGILQRPDIAAPVKAQAEAELSSGVPFISDQQLEDALTAAGVDPQTTQAVVEVNQQARLDGLRSGLAVAVLLALLGLFLSGRIPREAPGQPQLVSADP